MTGLFLKIINMSISASWLIVAVLICRLALKKAPRWVNVLLWGIAAVRLLFPFSIESDLSLIPSAETVSPEIMTDASPTINTGIPAINSAVNPVISQTFAPSPVTSANPLQIWLPVLAVAWVIGVVGVLAYTAATYWRLRRKVSTAVLLRDNIFQSENVSSPFVLGIIKPKIYLPFKLDGQNMGYVIAHELAHIGRRDHWWKPLGFLLLAVYWFNPLMWLAYVLLCRDIELACDEKVIKELGSEQRADYTQALLTCSVSRRMIAACPLAFGEVGVKERVKSVMNYKKPAFWIIVLAVAACAVVAVCFLTNPKSDELDELPLLHPHNYGVIEVTYETSGTSFSMVAKKNTPAYAITEGMRLMSKGEHTIGDEWTDLGVLTETELTKENFDELFFRKGKWFTNETASTIRKNNANAWSLVYNQDVLYYVLQQKNGEVYLAYGYYDYSEKDDPYSDDTNIRWLYRLELDFNENADNASAEDAANQRENSVVKCFDYLDAPEEMPWDGYLETNRPEFPDVTFRWSYATVSAVTETGTVQLYSGMPIWSVYFYDLTGDGLPELCSTLSYGSGLIDTRIFVYDYANSAGYVLEERGFYDYMLRLDNGDGCLYVDKKPYSSNEPVSSWQLTLSDGKLYKKDNKFTGFISEVYPDTNSIAVCTDDVNFLYADDVLLYLPDDISASRFSQTSWVDITYAGVPEIVFVDNPDGSVSRKAVIYQHQLLDILDYFVD